MDPIAILVQTESTDVVATLGEPARLQKKPRGETPLASLLSEAAALEPGWPAAATSDRGASQATRES
jgi:hypothetical protein